MDHARDADAGALELAEGYPGGATSGLGGAHDGLGYLRRLTALEPVLLLAQNAALAVHDRGAHVRAAEVQSDVDLVA